MSDLDDGSINLQWSIRGTVLQGFPEYFNQNDAKVCPRKTIDDKVDWGVKKDQVPNDGVWDPPPWGDVVDTGSLVTL